MEPVFDGVPPVWFQAFPSGHTMAATVAAVVLWHYWPKLRAVAVLLPFMVITGLLGLYYHYLGDIIAGLWFGYVFAWLAIYWEKQLTTILFRVTR
jgi:membrane-associated phospholipid phosphatase